MDLANVIRTVDDSLGLFDLSDRSGGLNQWYGTSHT